MTNAYTVTLLILGMAGAYAIGRRVGRKQTAALIARKLARYVNDERFRVTQEHPDRRAYLDALTRYDREVHNYHHVSAQLKIAGHTGSFDHCPSAWCADARRWIVAHEEVGAW